MGKLHIHGVHSPGFILFFVSLQYPLILLTLSSSTSAQSSSQFSSVSPINDMTRIFRNPLSQYVLEGINRGTHIVRLHLFPFASTTNLSEAVFDVSHSHLLPDRFIPGSAPSVGTLAINSSNYSRISSQVLRTVYRINVGGDEVALGYDPLWRSCVSDGNYIHVPNAAYSHSYEGVLNYQDDLDKYLASERVCQTAMVMNESARLSYPNTTWNFKVSANASHLVRAHFCDIISRSLNMVTSTHSVNGFLRSAAPFHYDFVVQPRISGLVSISIGLLNASDTVPQQAYLNDLEIMEIIGSWDSHSEVDNQNKHVGLIIGLVSGSIVLICVSAAIFICKYRKLKRTETWAWSPLPAIRGGSSHSELTERSTHSSAVPNLHLGLKVPLAEIHVATNNFDGKLLIGKGGFGNVYRGTLGDGTKVAVKQSEPGSLIGYCAERSEMILVYEFMDKGSLKDHLYNSDFPCLPWKQRLQICIGAARGLNYLHKGAAGGIIHRDIKSTNILLDENYVGKVADFGLSKSGPLDESQTHVSTGVEGTFGYLDPEYFKTQQLTEKSDVYSFGVVLLEVLCARPAIDPSLPRDQANLAEWGIACMQNGIIEQIVDPLIAGQINPNSLRKYGELQQTAVKREMYNDSVTNGSSLLTLSDVRKLPSFSTDLVEEEGVGKE
ncbi:hypothetical protein ACJRO7_034377 [Eucalyptus globulus]|uniref:Protein kinase domain-containing protein n=1 Tax=Eucalyptus globulus TaxID=34317 RepID=A0ABD3J8V7_EUCGL